jgi:Fungal cellulose binding domain
VDCMADTCGAEFEKCAGTNMTGSTCCEIGLHCVVKNYFYAQCLTMEHAAKNIADEGWDGRELTTCEGVPDDAAKGPGAPHSVNTSARRLAQVWRFL